MLDVRSGAEFDAGHIPGSINIPFWAVPWRAADLRVGADHPIVVYCGHGPRALFARAVLAPTRLSSAAGRHMANGARPHVRSSELRPESEILDPGPEDLNARTLNR